MEIVSETPRLLLRRFTPDDAALLIDLDGDPAVTRLLNGGQPVPPRVIREETLPRFLAYYDQPEGYGYWAAIERATGEFIGWFQLRPSRRDPANLELGYRLRQAAWGHGYATEGARALLDKGFTDLGARRIVAETLVENTASINVMRKIGLRFAEPFVYEGTPGAWHVGRAGVEYGLDRDEWLPTRGTSR